MNDESKVPGERGSGDPPTDESLIIEFVDHEEGPYKVKASEPLEAAAAAAAAGPGSEPSAEQEERIRDLEERILRLRADYENYHKRVERDREEQRKADAAGILAQMLPTLDNLDRAADQLPEGVPENFGKGLALVAFQLRETLERMGLQEIPAQGQPFNPALHEAVATVEAEGVPPNQVVDVWQKGYTAGGRLIRPARVRVSAAPEGPGGANA